MKNSRILLLGAALLAAACTANKASVDFTIADAPSSSLVLKQLEGTATNVLDTVKTDAAGHFRYDVKVEAGQPEFIYVFKGDQRIASLLVEKGEKAVVSADTLGNYEVSGSAGSVLLKQGDDAFRTYVSRLYALAASGAPQSEINKEYVSHYRNSTRFVLSNSKSLAVIPVLYENIQGATYTFGGVNDALVFRSVCDSLKTVYPDSKYVKALEAETVRREQLFSLQNRIASAGERAYPALSMPSVTGETAELDSLDAKVKLLWFWDAREASHKIFNLDVLKPLYEQYKSKGLGIYAVCVDPDKAEWAQVVKSQDLPWVNVNDGLGTASRSLFLYNVQRVPCCLLLTEDGITSVNVGEKPLQAALAKLLK